MYYKTALVTGASRGIGRGIALSLAANGYQLHLNCLHSASQLEELKTQITKQWHVPCELHIGDISDEAFVKEMFSKIASLDVLINNAGISHIGLLSDMTLAEWNHILSVNLTSAFLTSRSAIPLMLQKQSGKIISISSMWGRCGASMEAAYSASKGGLNALTMALAKELAPSNIQVNAISCGVIDTDMNACFSREEMQQLIDEIPADRIGTTEDVANAVLSILNAGSYMTGQIIGVDGGYF